MGFMDLCHPRFPRSPAKAEVLAFISTPSAETVLMPRIRIASLCTRMSSRFASTVTKIDAFSSKIYGLPFHHSQEESKELVTNAIRKRIDPPPPPMWKRLFTKPQINTAVKIDVSCASVYWPLWIIDMRAQAQLTSVLYFLYEWNGYNIPMSGSDSHATRVFSQIPLSLDLFSLWEDLVTGDVGRYKPSMDGGQDALAIPFTTPPNELGRWSIDKKDPLPLLDNSLRTGIPSYHAYPIMVPLHVVTAIVSEGEHQWQLLYIVRADRRSEGTFFCVGDPLNPRYLPDASNNKSYLVSSDVSYTTGTSDWDAISLPDRNTHPDGEILASILKWLDKKREFSVSRRKTMHWADTRIGRLSDLTLNRAYDRVAAQRWASQYHAMLNKGLEQALPPLRNIMLSELSTKQTDYLGMAQKNCLVGGAPELYRRLRQYEQKLEGRGGPQ